MPSLTSILLLGFLLGMRHATDGDHVMAVATIVTRERSFRAAAPIGLLWGLGHTVTIALVGALIVFVGVVIPPRVGLGMELLVGAMLVILGALSIRNVRLPALGMRPLVVGIVHGLAGSAAVSLLVVGVLHRTTWAAGYLLVFGVGTIAGMLLITLVLAMPVVAAAKRFENLHRALGVVTGAASMAFGAVVIYHIGFVQGLLLGHG